MRESYADPHRRVVLFSKIQRKRYENFIAHATNFRGCPPLAAHPAPPKKKKKEKAKRRVFRTNAVQVRKRF